MIIEEWTEELVEYGELEWAQPDVMLNIRKNATYGWITKIIMNQTFMDQKDDLWYIELTSYEARALAAALVRVATKLEKLAARAGAHPTRHWRSPLIEAEQYATRPTRTAAPTGPKGRPLT